MFSGGIPAQLSSDASLEVQPAAKIHASQTIKKRHDLAQLGSFRISHNGAAPVSTVTAFRAASPPGSSCSSLLVQLIQTGPIQSEYKQKVPPTEEPYWPSWWRRASASCAIGSPARLSPLQARFLAPTDRSNGRLWEMMLLLCFRGLPHYLHPCNHAPPFFLRHAAAHLQGAMLCRILMLPLSHSSPFSLLSFL